MLINSIVIITIVIIIFNLLKKRNSYTKENLGEKEVSNILNKIKGYKLLNDIMIKGDSGTSQIDHILISKKGIFVIETKDYSGSIYGEEYSRYWTQIINKRKNQFYNPIRQNYGHVKALERYLKRSNIFISVIVFTNKSNLEKIESETPVLQVKKLKKFIRKYKSDIRLSKKEIEEIYDYIIRGNINSYRARKKHIKRISKNIS